MFSAKCGLAQHLSFSRTEPARSSSEHYTVTTSSGSDDSPISITTPSLQPSTTAHKPPPPTTTAMPPPVAIPTPLPSPLPPHIRTSLQSRLISANAVPSILTSLQSACAATGWEDKLRERVLEILREGEVGSRREVLRRILGEVRGEGEEKVDGDENGDQDDNGKGTGNEKGPKKTDIRIPGEGIKEGTKIVREVLETCVQIEPEKPEKDFWA